MNSVISDYTFRIKFMNTFYECHRTSLIPDSKDQGANMGPLWGGQDPGGPHVVPMNFAIWDDYSTLVQIMDWCHQAASLTLTNVHQVLWRRMTTLILIICIPVSIYWPRYFNTSNSNLVQEYALSDGIHLIEKYSLVFDGIRFHLISSNGSTVMPYLFAIRP